MSALDRSSSRRARRKKSQSTSNSDDVVVPDQGVARWSATTDAASLARDAAGAWDHDARAQPKLTPSETMRTAIDPLALHALEERAEAAKGVSMFLQRNSVDGARMSAQRGVALKTEETEIDFADAATSNDDWESEQSKKEKKKKKSLKNKAGDDSPGKTSSTKAFAAMQAEARASSEIGGSLKSRSGKKVIYFNKRQGSDKESQKPGSFHFEEDGYSSSKKGMEAKHVKYRRSWGVVASNKASVQRWNAYIGILLCYTAVATPLEVGFFEPTLNGAFYMNQIIAFSFFVDMVLNFFIAVLDPKTNHYVYDRGYIAKKYFRTWFIIDLVSIVPFDALYIALGSGALARLTVLRTLRLVRLLKLARMSQLSKLYNRAELIYTIDYTLIAIVKHGVTAVLFAHWLACGYGLVEDLENSKYSWMRSTEFDGQVIGPIDVDPRKVVSPWSLYVAALYWSTMTVTTIGYGDIVPVTMGERVYVIVGMLVGAFEYGYIVGAVSNIIATRNEKINKFQMVMRDLNGFLTEHRFPQHLRVRLREYFKYSLQGSDAAAHIKLLSRMSPALRGECTISMNKWMRNLEFFKFCPEPLVITLSMQVTEQMYPPQEKLFEAGDVVTKMFLIRKGVIQVDGRLRLSGKTVCEECLYIDEPVYYGAQAVTYADIFTLERHIFQNGLQSFPATQQFFRIQGIKKVFRSEMLAYCKAWRALRAQGVHAKLDTLLNKRPAHYLKKLRLIYGEDGEGLENPKLLEAKTKAAILIQKRFRGMLHRVLLHRILVERDVQGIFHKMLRERDPLSYTARAIDVFHARLAFSMTEAHRKLNALLDEVGAGDIPSKTKQENSLMANALRSATGKAMTETRVAKEGAPASTPSLKRVLSLQTLQQPAANDPARNAEPPRSLSVVAPGWSTDSINPPGIALQARIEELTARLVPLDRRITTAQAKQSAALAETNERLNDLGAQLEMLLKLTVTNIESGITESRGARLTRVQRDLSPPPASDSSRQRTNAM